MHLVSVNLKDPQKRQLVDRRDGDPLRVLAGVHLEGAILTERERRLVVCKGELLTLIIVEGFAVRLGRNDRPRSLKLRRLFLVLRRCLLFFFLFFLFRPSTPLPFQYAAL